MAAVLYAFPAERALLKLQDVLFPRKVMNTVGANDGTTFTADAQPFVEEKLRMGQETLRIVAPGASQRAALQEDSRSNARPVL